MQVTVCYKIHEDGFTEMGLWPWSPYGESYLREFAGAWIHGQPYVDGTSHQVIQRTEYVSAERLRSEGTHVWHIFLAYNNSAKTCPGRHEALSNKYRTDVRGRCVECKVFCMEAL